ncbi:MAG: hypothetical protein KAH56_12260 [Candidatus Krumholzibacteria bacterium]|nr:hypothetical protein [Candidatus Krumholzibacteria bacterium]
MSNNQKLLSTAVLVTIVLLAGTAGAQTSSTSTGVSRLMNPALSANGLFLARVSRDDPSPAANGIFLQEAEIQMTSVVDPFWTADLIVVWAQKEDSDTYDTMIETASLRNRSMPAGLGLTLGKFFLPFGKHAMLHPHQFPFIDAPLAIDEFIPGMIDVGVSMDGTLPLPWYSELVVYGVDGQAGPFNRDNRDLAFGARLSNMWDISLDGTLELGGSFCSGPNADSDLTGSSQSNIFGADLTYKWSSGSLSQGPAVNWTNEIVIPEPDRNATGNPFGFYSHFQYRFGRSWWLGVGGGLTRDKSTYDGGIETLQGWNEGKINVAFVPSEFSSIRAEISYQESHESSRNDVRYSLQWNFTIGSHPAHLY